MHLSEPADKPLTSEELDPTVPNIQVWFRRIMPSGGLSDSFESHEIPVTYMRFVAIGTVWKEGVCVRRIVWKEREFDLDAKKGSWFFQSFGIPDKKGKTNPYPREVHRPPCESEKSWFIKFFLKNNGFLVIPSLEYFVSCYGFSAEVTRVLSIHDKKEWPKQLYNPKGCFSDETTWYVQLRKRLKDADAPFIAHLFFDWYTKKYTSQINDSLHPSLDLDPESPVFPQIGPWFQGKFKIKMRGVSFNNGQSFLAHQIIGASWAEGPDIVHFRDNPGKALAAPTHDASQNAWTNRPKQSSADDDSIVVDLNTNVSPDHAAEILQLESDIFQQLDSPRKISKWSLAQAQKKRWAGTNTDSSATSYSSGENYGNNANVGFASISPKLDSNAKGLLRELWEAIRGCANGTRIFAEWYTQRDGFVGGSEPRLMAAVEVIKSKSKNNTPIAKGVQNWPYLDAWTKSKRRGVLVARLRLGNECAYFMDFQRRPPKSGRSRKNGYSKGGHSIFVFKTIDEEDSDAKKKILRLAELMTKEEGKPKHVYEKCEFGCELVRHTRWSTHEAPLLATVMNGLEKLEMHDIVASIKQAWKV